ncbi:MAG: DNA polymerase III subunit delta [Burkholderiales bacterium]
MIRLDALQSLLGRASAQGLPAVIWLAGDETLLVLEAADAVRRTARALDYTEREVLTVERGFRIESLLEHSQALSLFATRKLIELRFSGKPGKEIAESLAQALVDWPEDVRLLVTSPRLDRAAQASAWFGRIEACGIVVGIDEVSRSRLPEWLGQRLARQGQKADAETLRLIAERVEGNLLAADQEVRKLGLLMPQGALDARQVREAVMDVARWEAFDLVDAALAGDAARSLRCLQGLRSEGTAVPVVLWALADAVRSLDRVQQAMASGQSMATAMRAARIWGERERLVPNALRRLTSARLARMLRECARADRMTKGLEDGDDWQALESVALALAGAPVLDLP